MMKKMKAKSLLLSLILSAFVASCAPASSDRAPLSGGSAEPTIESELPPLVDVPPQPSINVDLMLFHQNEVSDMPRVEMNRRNDVTIQDLYRIPLYKGVATSEGLARVGQISPDVAQKLYDSVMIHPVVSPEAQTRYEQPGVKIGYCFGRATYVHKALQKMGVADEAIRKVWMAGTMYKRGTQINWDFHVATAVRATDGKWYVIDYIPGKLLTVEEWYNFYLPLSYRKNLRFYYTDPSRFHTGKGTYSRANMGLDTTRENDWYRHYFVDLLAWFENHSLAEVGLPTDLP